MKSKTENPYREVDKKTKIRNPFRETIKKANNGEVDLDTFTYPLNIGCAAAFDMGVVATRPRKFSDELPIEEQKILMFIGQECRQGRFFKEFLLPETGTYHEFTHWQPYPELD